MVILWYVGVVKWLAQDSGTGQPGLAHVLCCWPEIKEWPPCASPLVGRRRRVPACRAGWNRQSTESRACFTAHVLVGWHHYPTFIIKEHKKMILLEKGHEKPENHTTIQGSHCLWQRSTVGWTDLVLLLYYHSHPKGYRIKRFSVEFFGRCMSWKYQECFMLITGILSLQKDFIKKDVFHAFPHSGKIQHPLTWNTAFSSLCLDLHGCAQLLASILLSLAFPGRSRNKSSTWEKWPWPGQAFPHLTSLHRPGRGTSLAFIVVMPSHVSGLMTPETKTQLRSN